MLLGIKTDNPTAELYLLDTIGALLFEHRWRADRELARLLLAQIEELLGRSEQGFDALTGIIIFRGPGSFTGLRIGATVGNSLAYSLGIPVVGTIGEQWCTDGAARLERGEQDGVVLPEYGMPARVTQQKK